MSQTQSLGISSAQDQSGNHGYLRKFILNVLKAVVTVGILTYLYKKGMLDFSRVHGVLTNTKIVAGTFLIFLCTNLAAVVRWRLLLKGQKMPLSMWQAVRLTMIGLFFNTAIPGAVSGDLIKGYYVVRGQPDGRGRIRAFTTLLLDRVLGLSALVGVSFFAMAFNLREMLATPALKPLCALIAVLWLGVVVFFAFVLLEWTMAKKLQAFLLGLPGGKLLARFFEAIKAYESCRHLVIRGLFISLGIHCSIIAAFLLLSGALGGFEAVPASRFFFLVPFGLLVTAIPISPAGLGTGHAAFLGLFQLVGSSAGADLFTAYVSFQLVLSLIGGLFYLRHRGHLPKSL